MKIKTRKEGYGMEMDQKRLKSALKAFQKRSKVVTQLHKSAFWQQLLGFLISNI